MALPVQHQPPPIEVGDSAWVEILPPNVHRTAHEVLNRTTAIGDASQATIFRLWAKQAPDASQVAALSGAPLTPGQVDAKSPSCTSGLYARAESGGTAFVSAMSY